MSNGAPTRFMTTGEASAYLRLKERTLQDMRVDGTGPSYFKMGRASACGLFISARISMRGWRGTSIGQLPRIVRGTSGRGWRCAMQALSGSGRESGRDIKTVSVKVKRRDAAAA